MIEIYLAKRQLATLRAHAEKIPQAFEKALTLDEHQKAIKYGTARLKLSILHLVWDAILLFYWFPFRGAERLYKSMPEAGIHREVLFLLSFTVIQTLLSLPWSLYSTFVLEEKFGQRLL